MIISQLSRLAERVVMRRSALPALYTAIGLLVATSISIGILALVEWRYGGVAVCLGLAGACSLLYGSLLLIREARLAIGLTLEEMAFVRELVSKSTPDTTET